MTLAEEVGRYLKQHKLMAATAESCTAGYIAKTLTDPSGSSSWFERGFVTYSNEAKMEMLGVREETLIKYGAVSEEVASQMAEGAVRNSRADIGVAVSGIAGPTGDTPDKPVGMVCFGWAGRGAVETETKHFSGDRDAVRRQTVIYALERLMT